MRLVHAFALFVFLASASQVNAGFLVVSTFTPNIQKFDASTGQFQGTFVDGSAQPTQVMNLTFGPDGNLYSTSDAGVHKYDGTTGAILTTFGPAGINFGHLTFGMDGLLYLSRPGLGLVQRYDASTETFVDDFISVDPAVVRVPGPLAFGSDGSLYLGAGTRDQGNGSANITKYSSSGAFLGEVVPGAFDSFTSSAGVEDMAFGPDGLFYFTKGLNDVVRYDPSTGQFETFITYSRLGPALAFGPDGNLYTGSDFHNSVLKFDGVTGAFLGTFASADDVGGRVFDLAFAPNSFAAVPEPSSLVLTVLALVMVAGFRGIGGARSQPKCQ